MVSYPFGTPNSHDTETGAARLVADASVVSAEMDGTRVWLALSHDAVRETLSNPTFSRALALGPDIPQVLQSAGDPNALTNLDPPRHFKVRKVFAAAFNPRVVAALTPQVTKLVDSLLDEVEAHGAPADLARLFTAPLPIAVISDLLGVPDDDRERLAGWARRIMASTAFTPDEITAAFISMREYIGELIAAKRANPGDDLTSALVSSAELSAGELIGNLHVLAVGGHDTTTNQLGNAIVALLRNPDQVALLRADPELMPQAVEELMRFTRLTPGLFPRVTKEDVELGGQVIKAGEAVVAVTATANIDPRVYQVPDKLDILRSSGVQHVTFGHGTHFCLGAHLARLELRTALTALLARFPNLALAVDESELAWREGTPVRALCSLPVTWN